MIGNRPLGRLIVAVLEAVWLRPYQAERRESSMSSLDGRVAIITGAGRGIGREHALFFAAEEVAAEI